MAVKSPYIIYPKDRRELFNEKNNYHGPTGSESKPFSKKQRKASEARITLGKGLNDNGALKDREAYAARIIT